MVSDLVLPTLFRSTLGLTFLFAAAWVAYLLVCRGLGETRASARFMATLSITLVLQHGLLVVLNSCALWGLHLFRPRVALPAMLLLAVLAHRRFDGSRAAGELRSDLQLAVAAFREVTGSWVHRMLLGWAAVAAIARALGGMVSPPLTWDTLTYHAFKSAEWVQYGFKVRTLAPDQLGYLTYYPDAAEAPGAWSMLFLHTDFGLPFVGIGLWAACGFAAYALARLLQATRMQAFRAALLIAFLPALLGEMVSGYSDMFVLLAFLALGSGLLLLFRRRGRAEAVLVGATAGLVASSKWSGVPVACLAVGFVLVAPGSLAPRLSRLRAVLWAGAWALLMAGPHYLRIWIERGSPFYPFRVTLAGWVVSAGNHQLHALLAGDLGVTNPRWASTVALAESLTIPFSVPGVEFVGFGPALIILVPLGCVALLTGILRVGSIPRNQRFFPSLALVLLAILPLLGLMSKDLAGQRAMWLPNLGRLLLPLPATLAILGAGLRNRTASVCMVLAVVVNLVLAWPSGMADPMLEAISELAPWLALSQAIAVVALLVFARFPALRRRHAWGMPAMLAIAGMVLLASLAKIREDFRYRIYRGAAASPPAFIMQFTRPEYAAAWPLWRAVDDGRSHRIAACYGWDGLGHNGLRYPLLGSNLQNRVLYVPIARGDGPIIDYQDAERVRREMDDGAWIARLRRLGIDLVFLGEPAPPERQIVLRHPERFQLVGRGQYDLHALYRFIP